MKTVDIAKLRLQNQRLIHPTFDTPQEVAQWMGAMQGQDLSMCQWAVGIRMKKPSRRSVQEAFNQGDLLRTHLNRGTWQVVAKEDIRWMLLLHGERCARSWRSFSASSGIPITDKMVDASRELLRSTLSGGRCMAREEIMPLYKTIDIEHEYVIRHLMVIAEAEGVLCNGPLKGRSITYTLLDERIPDTLTMSREDALAQLAMRYFQSHSPATLNDYVWWSGLPLKECRMGMEQIEQKLQEVTIGSTTYYLYENNLKGAMPKELVLLIPPFDEILIGYKDRTPLLSEQFKWKAHNNSGIFYPIVLHNRQIVGNWARKDLACDFFHEDVPTVEGIARAQEMYRRYDK